MDVEMKEATVNGIKDDKSKGKTEPEVKPEEEKKDVDLLTLEGMCILFQ